MSENIETQEGFWFIPEHPEDRVVGTIKYSPIGGTEVSIIGNLPGVSFGFDLRTKFTLWGLTLANKPVSLFNCYLQNTQTHLPGHSKSRVNSGSAIIGGHYNSLDELLVRRVMVTMDHLNDWAATTGIQRNYDLQKRTMFVNAAAPKEINFGEYDGITMQVVPGVHISPDWHSIEIHDYSDFHLSSPVDRSFRDYERFIRSFQQFLSLAVGEPARMRSLKAQIMPQSTPPGFPAVMDDIEIIQSMSQKHPIKKLRPEQMLFTRVDLEDSPEHFMKAFLSSEEILKPTYELFFPTYFFPDLPSPQEFLNLAHAIEGIHVATIGGKYQSDEEYNKDLRKRIAESLPADLDPAFKSSIKKRLQYLNNFSLRKRLKDILEKYENLVTPFVGDIDDFNKRIVESRNQLVHADLNNPPVDYLKLWDYAQQLGLIMEIVILDQIGFDIADIGDLVNRGKRAELIRNNINVW